MYKKQKHDRSDRLVFDIVDGTNGFFNCDKSLFLSASELLDYSRIHMRPCPPPVGFLSRQRTTRSLTWLKIELPFSMHSFAFSRDVCDRMVRFLASEFATSSAPVMIILSYSGLSSSNLKKLRLLCMSSGDYCLDGTAAQLEYSVDQIIGLVDALKDLPNREDGRINVQLRSFSKCLTDASDVMLSLPEEIALPLAQTRAILGFINGGLRACLFPESVLLSADLKSALSFIDKCIDDCVKARTIARISHHLNR